MSGKPAEVEIEDTEYNSYLAVKMEGAPMDIEALCNASACTTGSNSAETEEIVNLVERESEWSVAATFSLIVLAILAGVSLVLLVCFLVFYLIGRTTAAGCDHGDSDEQHTLGKNSSQVLEFRNISKTVYLKSNVAKSHGNRKSKILDGISGSVKSGSMMGVMGPRCVHSNCAA